MNPQLTRRKLLQHLGLGSVGLLLAGCQPSTPAPTPAPQVVKETVVVAGTPKVVEKTVVVAGTPKVVEKLITPAPAPQKPVKLRVIPTLNPGQGGEAFWKATAKLYETTYPGRTVELNIQPSWDTLWNVVRGSIAAGDPPDVWGMQENGPGIFWKQGATLALDALVAADRRWPTWCKAVGMQISEEYTYNNHLMAVPIYSAPLLYMYNKKHFEKVGLSYPKTVDEVVSHGLKFQQAGWQYPFWINAPIGWGGHPLIWSFGAPGVTDKSGKKQMIDTPEFLAACEWYWDLVHTHKLINPAYLKQAPQPQVEAGADKIVLWQVGSWNFVRYMENRDLWGVLGVAPSPAGPGGSIQVVGGSALMISAKTQFAPGSFDFCMVANDPNNLADNWIIPNNDAVSNCEAYQKPQVKEKAPIMFDVLSVMEKEGRVVWTVPWYNDAGTIAQSMVLKMLELATWQAAKAIVPEYAAQAQKAIDEGVKKYGDK